MTNVPVKRGEAARQQPQVATTDADREAVRLLQRYTLGGDCYGVSGELEARMEWSKDGEYVDFDDALKAIARARAEEREACAKHVIDSRSCNVGHSFQPSQCEECYWFDSIAAIIRARGEGGKA